MKSVKVYFVYFIAIIILFPTIIQSSLLESDYGSRPVALGNSYVAVGGDPVSIFWNPAGLPEPRYGIITLGYQMKIADMKNYEFFGTSKEFLQGYWGLGVVVWSAEEEGWDELNELTGTIKANEYLIGVAYKRSFFGVLSAGVTFKYDYNKIVDSTENIVAIDIGARSVLQGIGIGFVIKNIGIGGESLPMGMVLGGWYTFFKSPDRLHSISATADLSSVQNIGFNLKTGIEYSFRKIAFLRIGYNTVPSAELGMSAKFRVGLGVKYYGADLSYTLSPYGPLGYTHEINLTYNLDTAFGVKLKDNNPPEINFSADSSLISKKNNLNSIKFKIEIKDDKGISEWQFFIKNSDGKVVYREEESGLENIKYVIKEIDWEGLSFNNRKLKDDKYIAVVRAYDLADNINASSIDNLFISEDDYDVIIEANRKQISEKQSVTITLLKRIRLMQKKWKLIIKDEDKDIVRTISGKGGFRKAVWDGKDKSGMPVLPGKYYIQLEVTFGNNVTKPSNIIDVEVK